MKSKKVILFTLLFFSAFSFRAENPPYKNPELSPDERALDLLNRMTLKEKFAQMHNNSGGIERLGVRPYDWWNEALHGIARAGKATVFPQAIGLAATLMIRLFMKCSIWFRMKEGRNIMIFREKECITVIKDLRSGLRTQYFP